nr:ATP-binding protein [Propionibacterium sp.]
MARPADPRPAPAPDAAASGPTPVRVIAGHYGSGKTEFAVSLALRDAARGRRVALVDLDIVNPYFRSRERAGLLEAAGVRVISSSLGHVATVEIPAIAPEVRAPIADPTTDVIVDLGGDDVGARVAVQLRADLRRRGYELLIVVNAHRPETRDAAGVLRHLDRIAAATGLTPSGLVSATHLLRETTPAHVLAGLALCREVAGLTGLPIRYVAAIPDALAGLPAGALLDRGRPIEAVAVGPHLREDWM